MRRLLIAGNWKMNTNAAEATALASAIAEGVAGVDAADLLVAPPFPYLAAVKAALGDSAVLLAGQNCSPEAPGAFTGEVAVEMLADVGCSHVILGHSERRHVLGETNEFINRKVLKALAGNLRVILCVGELLEEREADRTEAVLDEQMAGGLAGISVDQMADVVIAYEPVWAIGTGKTATPDQAVAAHSHLRKWLADQYNTDVAANTRILYGGSVKPDNAGELLASEEIDGALVGGASLKADSFLGILNAGT